MTTHCVVVVCGGGLLVLCVYVYNPSLEIGLQLPEGKELMTKMCVELGNTQCIDPAVTVQKRISFHFPLFASLPTLTENAREKKLYGLWTYPLRFLACGAHMPRTWVGIYKIHKILLLVQFL